MKTPRTSRSREASALVYTIDRVRSGLWVLKVWEEGKMTADIACRDREQLIEELVKDIGRVMD